MNYQILFYTQIIQNIWWIICSFLFYNPFEYYLFILSASCVAIRVIIIIIQKRFQLQIIKPILFLLLNCLYTEANLRMPMNNPIINHVNSLMIIVNYQQSNMFQQENTLIISKLGFPIYSLLRTISLAFIESNYFILESCILLFIFVIVSLQKELKKKNEIVHKLQDSKIEEQHHIQFHSKFQTFQKNDSNKQSLQNSLKKSRTHCSIYQDKQDDLTNIPFFYGKQDNGENLKTSLQKMASLKKSYNKKFSIGSVDKQDQQLHTFFQNIINNIFSAGVVIINQHQKVTFMNYKCEKLLEQKGSEKVIEFLRKIIIANALNEDEEIPLTPIPPKSQATMNKATLERIIRQHNHQSDFDVFDAILFPQKHLSQFYQSLSPNTEFEQRSSLSESINETFMQRKDALIYEHLLDNEGSSVKKLKLVVIPTFMTNAQQEQLSFPSQQKVNINKINLTCDPIQPIIVIKIKNISKKHKIEQMNKEKEIHNSLLKSFSHELKTPLNSSQEMLLILKDLVKDQILLGYIEIAHISILFLIHQINDILDYAAMQSNSFKYRFTTFKIEDIIEEIKYIYSEQLKTKKIVFLIKFDEKLKYFIIKSDKQRIMQVLINLLNNSSKYTPEGGRIELSVKINDYPFIKISVKDSGIGIGPEQLSNLKRVLTSSMGKSLHRSRIKKSLGLGLNISARIVEGLVTKNDGTLQINSNHQNGGTKIYFLIENQMSYREESVRNPMISEYTTKNNTYKQQMSHYEGSQYSQDFALLRQISENSKNDIQSPSKKSKTNKSRFFNLFQTGPQDSFIEMIDQNTFHIDLPKSPQYFRHKSVGNETISRFTNLSICQMCPKILIVDDIPFNQIALKALLQHYKIKADQAYDGYQAINLVKKQQSKHCQFYTLIFMDIEMPGINGFQATKEILEITLNYTQIVMCSAYDTEENFREGEAVGITEFLPKPVQQKDLERILKRFSFI